VWYNYKGAIMKVRMHSNKKTGETFIEYGVGFSTGKYRFKLLKKIIESGPEAIIVIDTNQKTGAGSIQEAEEFLHRSGIKYSAFPIRQNNVKLFGFEIKKKALDQKMIIMVINGEQFSRELYDGFLHGYDIALGIGRQKPFEETCDMLRIDLREVLFNTAFFKESIYDSAVCGTLRSSTDLKPYIEAINETAL
jgi:hypothetical protein